jgi:transposase InsO family protein
MAAAWVRYGYRRLHVLLRREGWPVNHKRTYRLYGEEELSVRAKMLRHERARRYRVKRPGAVAPNEVWSIRLRSPRARVGGGTNDLHYIGSTETFYRDDLDDIHPTEAVIAWVIAAGALRSREHCAAVRSARQRQKPEG